MSGILSWFRKENKGVGETENPKSESDTDNVSHKGKTEQVQAPTSTDSLQDRVGVDLVVDSHVAEYFKDFPEPYREKAIQRFSKREGLFRWEIFRRAAMEREMESARRGVFLEDRREWLQQREELEQKHVEKLTMEASQVRDEKDIPAWEKFVLQYVPLQDDETMGWKLITVVNFSLLGAALMWQGFKFRRSNPHLERWRIYMQLSGSAGLCCLCQVGAVYRLMDWGIFDRSIDKRDAVTRVFDDAKDDAENLLNLFRGKGS
ncbi:uncharacterized protein LOC101862210 [Aplysia californica]|uniref:Uncharacterized protein LOC101862210 n=1 Tax=Aplysia californica TaxID=6500 RepID=A0ABM1VZE4_APLCA|nr:uncharacterized protein LOC101862210 [Aplysia californica]XP_035827787.1 uncharacterized protein LOC101862210 [Aplysia californica]XP_035827788.1 uncharacterized protein LOC101862210 [Aplysia californica]XP_035827789.1 uncharacterized protein LOC101862210 [Aplysia californica]